MKMILEKLGVEYEEINLSEHQQGRYIEAAIHLHTGFNSMPIVYFGFKNIGGYDDLKAYTQDKDFMESLLKETQIKKRQIWEGQTTI